MDLTSLALLTAEQIPGFAASIVANLATDVLVGMTKEDQISPIDGFEPELRRELEACVISCLSGETDEAKRILLARCLFDDVSIHEIVSRFLSQNYDAGPILDTAKSRLATGVDWDLVEPFVVRGVNRFVERFKYSVASNQILFNRLAMVGWERAEQQAADIRDLKHLVSDQLRQVQQTTADFPCETNQNIFGRSAVTNTSPLISSAGEFPSHSSTAVAFLKDDFENALNELKMGSAQKAYAGFELVVNRLTAIGVDTDRTLYFRALSNLGLSAYAASGSKEFAADCLEKAFPFSNGSVKGRINLALARSLQIREEEAVTILSAILLEDPDNFEALIHRGDSYLRLSRVEEALSDFRKAAPKNRQNFMNLAAAFLAANSYAEAAEKASALLAEYPDDPWGRIFLATAIGFPIVDKVNTEKFGTGYRPSEDLDIIHRALTLLEEALPWVRNCDRPDTKIEVLSNLAGFSSILGDHAKALRYGDEAVELVNCGEAAHRNRYLAAIITQQFEKALESAKALGEWMSLDETSVRQVEALKGLRRFREALDLIEEAKNAAKEQPISAYLRVLEVDITSELPDIEKAEHLSAMLCEDFPRDAIVWLTAAEIARIRNNPDQERFLKLAIECSDAQGLRLHCRGMLGQYYGRNSRWIESLEMLLPETPDENFATPHQVEIAVCYFNLGRHLEALRFAETRLQTSYDAAACHIAIQSCLAMVELEKARVLAELMQREDGQNQVAAWCFLAHLKFRLNQPEEARVILVSAIAKQENAKLLLLLSEINLHMGEHEEALKNAIRSLEVAEDNAKSECHRAIVHISLCLPESAKIARSVRRRIRQSYTALARQQDSGFSAVPIEPDFAALKKLLKAQQKAASEGQKLFTEQGLPIYILTYLAGRDIESVWRGLVAGNGLQINMANGSEEDQKCQHHTAFSCDGVVVDATALLTFRLLGLLDKLPQIFRRIVVSFRLYETLLHLLNEAKHGPESAGWIALVDDNLHLRELEKGERERAQREVLEPILAFLEKIDRVGYQEPQEINDAGSFLKHCSPDAWSAVLISEQSGLPLLCDDAGTVQIAGLACNVSGFSSQTALRVGQTIGAISDDEYADAVIRLFESNYKFVSDDAHSMINYLSRNNWHLSPPVRGILERFDSGAVTRVSACRILGAILAHAWLRAPDKESRKRWVSYICERLRSVGNADENFATAFLGAIGVYSNTPDLFAGMIQEICRVEWLPADLVSSIKDCARFFMRTMNNRRLAHLGSIRNRWVELSRVI